MATAKSPPSGNSDASNVLTQYIVGNIKGLQAAYTQAGKLAKQFEKTMNGPMHGVTSGFEKMGEGLKEWIGPLAAAATAWLGFHEVMESFERAEILKNTAADLGITVDQLGKLQYAASLSGQSAEGMDKALRNMTRFLNDATDSSSTAAKKLQELGLSTADFAGMSADEAMGKFADALKDTATSGQRASTAQAIFGREARKMGGIIEGGSKGLKELGDEGERMGRVLTALDVAKLMIAKDSMEKLGTAVKALADRISLALAPVFSMIADLINEWIGDTRDFDDTFQSVAKGVVIAIGVIKMVWQGMTLLWEGAKIIVAELALAFDKSMYAIAKTITVIGETASRTWKWIGASWNASIKGVVLFFDWAVSKIFNGIDYIRESFGHMMIDIGLAAERSGVKGLMQMGDKLAEAGKDLVVAAVKSKQGTAATLEAARKGFDQSLDALDDARKHLTDPIDTSNKMFDDQISQIETFRDDAIQAMADISDAMNKQQGGNAITDMLDRYAKKVAAMQDEATKKAQEGADNRAVIDDSEGAKKAKYLADRKARYDEYAFGIWKTDVDSAEKSANVEMQKAQLNKSIMSKMQADHAEFNATRESRDAAYHDNILKASQSAVEALASLQNESDADRTAKQTEFNANHEMAEKNAVDQQVMLWRSGAMGKMQAIGGILDQLESLMTSKSKSLFEIGKIAAIANTVIHTISAAMANYDFGAQIGGPILGGVFASIAVLAGMVRVQQLMATKFGGGAGSIGGGGGSAGTSGAAYARGAATSNSQQQMNVTLVGDSFSSNQVRGLISHVNSAVGDNLNLQTKDEGAS